MDISSIFNDAFEYTRRMFVDLRRLVILIVLDIIPIVNFTVAGYAAKVVRETPASDEPPVLKDYGEMWVQGLKIAVASVIWMVAPIILIAMSFGLAVGFGLSGFPVAFGAWILLGVVGVVAAFVIAIILSIAIVHMIKHDSFSKAFAVAEILDIIRRIGWGKYILWLIVVFLIVLVIAAIGTIPVVGWLISLIIGPLFTILVSRSASLIYIEGVSTPTVATGETRFCRKCGESLTPDAAFCPKCGEKVE
jgi:hypothetical protein